MTFLIHKSLLKDVIEEGEEVMHDRNRPTPLQEEIRIRAYEIYSARGRADGKELNDWLMAEKELTEQNSVEMRKTKTADAG
ncbi:MAG TPA: DUF2934 domain-containing protein [Candidatus Acidoferrum sp.]|nr:DUF2934 domain-containing protein [Candidatus Acidoferrum sp.]